MVRFPFMGKLLLSAGLLLCCVSSANALCSMPFYMTPVQESQARAVYNDCVLNETNSEIDSQRTIIAEQQHTIDSLKASALAVEDGPTVSTNAAVKVFLDSLPSRTPQNY